MAIAVSILDALTTLACAILLLRGYARTNKKLLLWRFRSLLARRAHRRRFASKSDR